MRMRAAKRSEIENTNQFNVRVGYYPLIRYVELESEVRIAKFHEPRLICLRAGQKDREVRTKTEHRKGGLLPHTSLRRARIRSQKSEILKIEHFERM